MSIHIGSVFPYLEFRRRYARERSSPTISPWKTVRPGRSQAGRARQPDEPGEGRHGRHPRYPGEPAGSGRVRRANARLAPGVQLEVRPADEPGVLRPATPAQHRAAVWWSRGRGPVRYPDGFPRQPRDAPRRRAGHRPARSVPPRTRQIAAGREPATAGSFVPSGTGRSRPAALTPMGTPI
jgi:hypothetical protein